MLTKAPEFMKYIRASAGRAGLSVVWEDSNQPRHDGKTIYLPKVTMHSTEEDFITLMCSVDHEVAHDKFSDFSLLKKHDKLFKDNPIVMFVWNFLEDSRINSLEAKEFRGFRENWDASCPKVLGNMAKELKKTPAEDPVAKIIPSLVVWESEINKDTFPTIEIQVKKDFKADEKFLETLKEKYTEDLIQCQRIRDKEEGSKSTFELALKILGKENIEEKEEEKRTKEKELKDSSTSKEGEEKEGKVEHSEEYDIIKVKVTKEQMDKLSVTVSREASKMNHVGINFDLDKDLLSHSKYSDWDLTNFEDFIVVDYPRNTCNHGTYTAEHFATSYFIKGYEERVGSKIVSQENFAQQVRRLIQIRAKVQTQYGVKRGKLDQSRLSRVCFKSSELGERIFKNKIKNTTLDSAVTILIDMSGSMSGEKAYYSLASALLMSEVCTTLNIPLEVLGFTDGVSVGYEGVRKVAPIMFIYKGFHDLRVSPEDTKNYVAKSSGYMLGNPDGENILWAYDRLLKRKEKNRIMIVMSDGNPAASKAGHAIIPFTAKVVKEIEQQKKVFIYGLGLCSSAVREFYTHHSIVSKPEEIPQQLLLLFEKRIIKND